MLAAVTVCAYALLAEVLPNEFCCPAPKRTSMRAYREPYGYWNAIGLTAAMGAIGCLWLGARRAGHALLNALAYPAMGLTIVTLMLAYSRGALAALLVGVIRLDVHRATAPARRTRADHRRAWSGAGGGLGFLRHALSSEGVALAARTTAGHQLGVLIGAMLIVLALVGIAIGFFGDRRAPSAVTRRTVGDRAGIVACTRPAGRFGWSGREPNGGSPARSPTISPR